MAKSKSHKVTMRLSFERPCSARHALACARDCIHGEFFPYQRDMDVDPGTMKVGKMGPAPKPDRALLAVVKRLESFAAGFEDDELQEGMAELLADARAAIAKAEGRDGRA